jgi:hypothetical protein
LKLQTSEKIAIAELLLRSNISLKSCGIAIAEVLPSSCGIAITDSKKSYACSPLTRTEINISCSWHKTSNNNLYINGYDENWFFYPRDWL